MKRIAIALAAALLTTATIAEKADRSKPMNVSAKRTDGNIESGDGVLDGDVRVQQGTMQIRADKAIIKTDPEGYRALQLLGKPVNYKEKREKGEGFIEAFAARVDYNEKTSLLKLTGSARITSPDGELKGETITYNVDTGAYQVEAASSDPNARVTGVILPRNKATPDAAASPPAQLKTDSDPKSLTKPQ